MGTDATAIEARTIQKVRARILPFIFFSTSLLMLTGSTLGLPL
jgi:hypothetical protein